MRLYQLNFLRLVLGGYSAAECLDTKGAGEFFANLSQHATEQSGLTLAFKALA